MVWSSRGLAVGEGRVCHWGGGPTVFREVVVRWVQLLCRPVSVCARGLSVVGSDCCGHALVVKIWGLLGSSVSAVRFQWP